MIIIYMLNPDDIINFFKYSYDTTISFNSMHHNVRFNIISMLEEIANIGDYSLICTLLNLINDPFIKSDFAVILANTWLSLAYLNKFNWKEHLIALISYIHPNHMNTFVQDIIELHYDNDNINIVLDIIDVNTELISFMLYTVTIKTTFNMNNMINILFDRYAFNEDTLYTLFYNIITHNNTCNADIVQIIIKSHKPIIRKIICELIENCSEQPIKCNTAFNLLVLQFKIRIRVLKRCFINFIKLNDIDTFNFFVTNVVHYTIFHILRLVSLYCNRPEFISIVYYLYCYNTLHINDLDNLFIMVCRNNNDVAREWFVSYFPHKYNNMTIYHKSDKIILEPLLDIYFIACGVKSMQYKQITEHVKCPICLDICGKVIELSCHPTHVICINCIKQWYDESYQCPICRKPIEFDKCTIFN